MSKHAFCFFALTFVIINRFCSCLSIVFRMQLQVTAKALVWAFTLTHDEVHSRTSMFGLPEYILSRDPATSCTSLLLLWIWLTSGRPQTKACVHLCNYVSFIKSQTLVVCCFLFFATKTIHVCFRMFIARPQNHVVLFTVHRLYCFISSCAKCFK